MPDKLDRPHKSNAEADVEAELEAIRGILSALAPLNDEARNSVISYVFKRLGISVGQPKQVPYDRESLSEPTTAEQNHARGLTDIRSLKEEKRPSSAREMAVLVAYYLSEIAPNGERKNEISADDIRQYFKQGAFKLPASPEMTPADRMYPRREQVRLMCQ